MVTCRAIEMLTGGQAVPSCCKVLEHSDDHLPAIQLPCRRLHQHHTSTDAVVEEIAAAVGS